MPCVLCGTDLRREQRLREHDLQGQRHMRHTDAHAGAYVSADGGADGSAYGCTKCSAHSSTDGSAYCWADGSTYGRAH